MTRYGIIYKITNTANSKVYIGQTIQSLKARKRDHRNAIDRLLHLPLYRAFRKYGFDNFDWIEIDSADSKVDLDQKEKQHIDKFRAMDSKYGYNGTFGGEGGRHPETVRQKISNSLKGRVKSEDERRRISQALKGKYVGEKASWWRRNHTEMEKRKISEAQLGPRNHNFGKKASDKTRRKMSEARKGEKHPNHKKVRNLDTGEVFVSACEAHIKTGIDNSLIGKCCKGTRKSAGGFRWAYLNATAQQAVPGDGPRPAGSARA